MALSQDDSQRILASLSRLPFGIRVFDSDDAEIWNSKAPPSASDTSLRAEVDGIPRMGAAIRRIDPLSGDFFSRVAEAIVEESGCDLSYVSRFIDDGSRYVIVGASDGPGRLGHSTLTAGAPCELVLQSRGFRHYRGDLAEMFPDDTDFVGSGLRTYAGSTYTGPEGMVLGHVFCLSKSEVRDVERLEHLLWLGTTAVAHALVTQRMSDELSSARRFSRTDALTGLHNRHAFDQDIKRFVERSVSGESGIFAFLDLDGMKQVNDTQGHLMGDKLLMSFAGALRSSLRPTDSVYRLGGDEFAVVWMTDESDLERRIRGRIEEAIEKVRRDGFPDVSVSVGIRLFREVDSAERLVADADGLMYEEKSQKRSERPSREAE